MTKEEKQKEQEIQMIIKRTSFVEERDGKTVRINKKNGMRFLLANQSKQKGNSNGN